MAKSIYDTLNIHDLAKLFRMPSLNKTLDHLIASSGTYKRVFAKARRRGATEAEADAIASRQAIEDERANVDDGMRRVESAIKHVANGLFKVHGLTLVPIDLGYAMHYKAVPIKSWRDAAEKIRKTINSTEGHSYRFRDLREFLDAGLWTPKEAVLGHLRWMGSYPKIHGDPSPLHQYEAYLR